MSELINNREYRQQKLKELIMKLHDGASVEQVKEEFSILTKGVTASEITEMEQVLVDEGMPVSEIQRLCDVHSAVFRGSIDDIHKDDYNHFGKSEDWHPLNVFKMENRAIEQILDEEIPNSLQGYANEKSAHTRKPLLFAVQKLSTIDKHYKRKENLIFPYMEKHGITAPPKVMWGVDDEIRELIKSALNKLQSDGEVSKEELATITERVKEMIFKEENIMIPMIIEKFTTDEWVEIEGSSEEIGYTLIGEVGRWKTDSNEIEKAAREKETGKASSASLNSSSQIEFDAGSLSAEELNAILNTVPIDMTFVGADNRVKYFTQGKERIFERPKTIIGREVKNCHPPKSVHIVEQIVEDLRSGKKDHEDFWIRMGGLFVYIRYFAVRNKLGEFMGTLEISQNIKPITELEGEKRLLSE
ncbi:MAG: DUF438 domain-containing protein [Clostridia bacterium]|nr:DUF438 domain-containing protein [Clostridia bacterium]